MLTLLTIIAWAWVNIMAVTWCGLGIVFFILALYYMDREPEQ